MFHSFPVILFDEITSSNQFFFRLLVSDTFLAHIRRFFTSSNQIRILYTDTDPGGLP